MTNIQPLGELGSVDPCRIWPDETENFTLWFAPKLDLLLREIRVGLTLISQKRKLTWMVSSPTSLRENREVSLRFTSVTTRRQGS